MAYYHTALKNAAINERRHADFIRRFEFPIDMEAEQTYGYNLDNELFDEALDWLDTISNPSLCEAIRKLPEQDQLLIYYIIVEEWRQCEIAELWGISIDAVSRRKRRILKYLKRNL